MICYVLSLLSLLRVYFLFIKTFCTILSLCFASHNKMLKKMLGTNKADQQPSGFMNEKDYNS